jgi:hypothetical protein
MRRTLSVPVAFALVGTAALVLAAPSTGHGEHGQREWTMHLVSKYVSSKLFDTPPLSNKVVTPGDSYVLVRSLFDKSGHNRVGSLHVSCTITSGGRNPWFLCSVTYALAGGHITGNALFRNSDKQVTIAITGGTGAYEGVLGSGTETLRDRAGNVADEVLHLRS